MEADRIYDNCIQNVESFEKVNRIRLWNMTFSLFFNSEYFYFNIISVTRRNE